MEHPNYIKLYLFSPNYLAFNIYVKNPPRAITSCTNMRLFCFSVHKHTIVITVDILEEMIRILTAKEVVIPTAA